MIDNRHKSQRDEPVGMLRTRVPVNYSIVFLYIEKNMYNLIEGVTRQTDIGRMIDRESNELPVCWFDSLARRLEI